MGKMGMSRIDKMGKMGTVGHDMAWLDPFPLAAKHRQGVVSLLQN